MKRGKCKESKFSSQCASACKKVESITMSTPNLKKLHSQLAGKYSWTVGQWKHGAPIYKRSTARLVLQKVGKKFKWCLKIKGKPQCLAKVFCDNKCLKPPKSGWEIFDKETKKFMKPNQKQVPGSRRTLTAETSRKKYPINEDNCGKRGSHGIRGRVVGGIPARAGDYPWQVAILVKKKGKWSIHCGGSIINKRFILTAAHCFAIPEVPKQITKYKVRVGATDLNKKKAYTKDYKIIKIDAHKGFNEEDYNHDIALLTLAEDITYHEKYIAPICLLTKPGQMLRDGQKTTDVACEVSGWGKTSEINTKGSLSLLWAQMPLVEFNQCKKELLDKAYREITNNMVCAGHKEGGKDACQGDSGGPLSCQSKNFPRDGMKFFLSGVVSYGIGCARPGLYGVYSRYTNYLDWIDKRLYA
jgi:hypothetical protein